jgi:hypothetical protein
MLRTASFIIQRKMSGFTGEFRVLPPESNLRLKKRAHRVCP